MASVNVAAERREEAGSARKLETASPTDRAPRASLEVVPNSVEFRRVAKLDTIVATKSVVGFDEVSLSRLSTLLNKVAHGDFGLLKFLVFEFAHSGEAASSATTEAFQALAAANASLILKAPVVSIAWARGFMSGADLEFALCCSMIVADREARFSFAADPAVSVGTYGLLAQKIGFVKAERLMEMGEVLGVEEMRDLLLVKHVVEKADGAAGMERFVGQSTRRYNASYNIYRAQRIAMPTIYERLRPPAQGAVGAGHPRAQL